MLPCYDKELDMNKVKQLTVNRQGIDYWIGDIHGCFESVETALAALGFDKKVDRLLSAGDLTDRGPQSFRVFEFLDNPWFHPVLGNHEAMAYQTAKLFLKYGRPYDIEYLKSIDENAQIFLDYGGEWMLDASDEFLHELIARYERLPIAIEYLDEQGDLLAVVVHAEVGLNESWGQVRKNLDTLPANYVFDLEDESNSFVAGKISAGNLMWSRDRKKASLLSAFKNEPMFTTKGTPLIISGHSIVSSDDGPWRFLNNRFIDHGLYETLEAKIYTYAQLI
jgi:hypothetical protein